MLQECEKDNASLSNEYRLLSIKYREVLDIKQDNVIIFEDFVQNIEEIRPRVEGLIDDHKKLQE